MVVRLPINEDVASSRRADQRRNPRSAPSKGPMTSMIRTIRHDRRAPNPERDDADVPFALVASSAGVVLGRTISCGSYRRYRAVGPLRQATRLQLLPDRKRHVPVL